MIEHVTIHHVRPDVSREMRLALQCCEVDPNATTIERFYAPAETVLHVSQAGEAYHQAQGETVNRTQNGRHMVHSAMSGDVFEVHDPRGNVTWWRCDSIGWTELQIDGEVENAGIMPHSEPLLA